MKKILFIIFAFVFLFAGAVVTKAQEDSSHSASSVNVTFPIAELGNCSSAADCKTYCDDPTHVDACVAYAKEKGFYKDGALDNNQETILADAKTILGCDSLDSCRAFCQQSQNADICSSFATKHHLQGGKKSIDAVTLSKAEATFGCTSAASCKAFCEDEANKTTCADFAKENNLNGGNHVVGPGGCSSESSCKVYCSDPTNFSACSSFVEHQGSGSGQHAFTGPGGCNSQSSCESFCDRNPSACHLNPTNKLVPNASSGAQLSDDCLMHPETCRRMPPVSGMPLRSNDREDNASGSGNDHPPLPPQQNNLPENRPNLEGQPRPNNPFPTVDQSVQGASTQRDFWNWFVDAILHVK